MSRGWFSFTCKTQLWRAGINRSLFVASRLCSRGGGRVLHPEAARIKSASESELTQLRKMQSDDPLDRSAASLYLSDDLDWVPDRLSRTAGVSNEAEVTKALIESKQFRSVKISASRDAIVHSERVAELCDRVSNSLKRLHEKFPLRFSIR